MINLLVTSMALSNHSSRDSIPTCDPQLILTDSLIGFIYEQLQAPDFDIGSYLNKKPINHNNTETKTEAAGSYLNLSLTTQRNTGNVLEPIDSDLISAPPIHKNAQTEPDPVDSYLNLTPEIHNNVATKLEPVDSYLNLTPEIHNNVVTKLEPVDSYLNLTPQIHNNAMTKPEPVGSLLNMAPPIHKDAETELEHVGSCLAPPSHNSTEAMPELVRSCFNAVPMSHNNIEPNPETLQTHENAESIPEKLQTHSNTELNPETLQVSTPNFFTATAPCGSSLHQNLYCMNVLNMCHAKTGFTPSQFMQNHQMCNHHFGTASLTNQVNVICQNTGFPVIPCAGPMQGAMPSAGQMQGSMPCACQMPAFKPASTQIVASRVRRKKISDKTQELAKLIPGGTHMNTAEMLLAAFKYVSFLQAQIGILAIMNLEEDQEAREVPVMVEEYMRTLLVSTNVQEQLSAQGKCLVPIKLAINLSEEMKSNAKVYKDLSCFLESISNKGNASSC